MKKFLLTALLWLFGFIGAFSYALDITDNTTSVNFVKDTNMYWEYSPDMLYFQKDFVLTPDNITSYSCPDNSYIAFSSCESEEDCGDSSPDVCYLAFDNSDSWLYFYEGYDCSFSEWDLIWLNRDDWNACNSFTIAFSTTSSGGWSSEWSDTLLSGGISQLSPVVSSISTVMWEFIPYVVYIWIGILLCTLWFTAIKWLVNWFSRKITRYFK